MKPSLAAYTLMVARAIKATYHIDIVDRNKPVEATMTADAITYWYDQDVPIEVAAKAVWEDATVK